MDVPIVMFDVNPKPKTGGEVYYLRMFQYLKKSNVNVRNVAPCLDILWLPLPVRLAIANFSISSAFLRLKLGSCILLEDCYSHMRFFLTNWLAKKCGAKIVLLMQFNIYQDHRLLRQSFWRSIDHLILRRFLQEVDVVLANSEQSARDVIALGCSPEKVRVVYCGVDIQLDSQAVHRWYEFDGRNFRLLFVGSVIERKGLCYLLEALAMLSDSRIELDVVGDTQDEPGYLIEIKKLIRDHRLDDQVKFHGHVTDSEQLKQLYRKADIFVLPSLYETFGIVLLEAMSFGLPIVATTAGAIPELVKNGERGILVPPKKPQAIANAIVELIDSQAKREQYSSNGVEYIKRVKHIYSWDTVGERIYTVLEECARDFYQ